MRSFAVLAFASLLLVSMLPAPVQAQATVANILVEVRADHANATFFVHGSGTGLPANIPITTVDGYGSAFYANLDISEGKRSVSFNASATPGWWMASAYCTAGTIADIGLVGGPTTTTCTLNLTRSAHPPEVPKSPKPGKPTTTPPRDDGHDSAPTSTSSTGGGPGAWKNADKTTAAATLNGWIGNVSAASAWLMPTGYAATSDGVRALLEDATRGCSKLDRLACETLRFEARYLVLRLNLGSGAGDGTAAVRLDNATAAYLGLPIDTTVDAVVGAIEGKAGGAAKTREELVMLRAASQRASAASMG